MAYASSVNPDLFYPECDGKPMADNTEQFRWIVIIKENLEILFAEAPDVFVAGDLLWYPVEGDNKTCQAPDAMVVLGRPKGKRGSYQQWKEGNIAPQVAFEILSPHNTKREMAEKREFYETHGVEEYYIYDPDRLHLSGWRRQGKRLVPIAVMAGWVSPRLGIRFAQTNGELEIYRPDGQRFLSSVELAQQVEQARQRAEAERLRAEAERLRAEAAEQASTAAHDRTQQLVAYLRSIGVDPDQI
jgi:Uma2 family endonuclease